MASGSVAKFVGKRGTSWKIIYRDSNQRQIRETLGKESDGWSRRKAEQALRERLVEVEKNGYVKPDTTSSFEVFALEWLEHHAAARGLKRSTHDSYVTIVHRHLLPAFGRRKLADVSVERIESYLRSKRGEGLAPTSLHRHLATLSLILGAAHRRRLVTENVVGSVQRPKATRTRWKILTPVEVVAVWRAWNAMIEEADPGDHRDDLVVARALYVTLVDTGIRRGEALGLRWKRVHLADPDGAYIEIVETWTRASSDTPKSAAGHRRISLSGTISEALFAYRGWTAHSGEDERVFVNPRTGHPINPTGYKNLFEEALRRAGIEGRVRPFHDMRHTSITNGAAAGNSPASLMQRAGHADYNTTKIYVDLGGEPFRAEADRLDARLWGGAGRPVEEEDHEAV